MQIVRKMKSSLQSIGLYPIARAIKRRMSGSIQQLRLSEQSLYREFIKPGDLVFDIGVNVGQKSEVFLDIGARVIGVEPNPNCIPAIEFQFGGNSNFTLVMAAVGSEAGTAVLHFVGSDATASLRADWPYLSVDGSPIDTASTPVITLDSLIEQYGRPRFCKIDVEGFELEVLKGLTEPLPYLSFEYHLSERLILEQCLKVAEKIGPIEVNVNCMDDGSLFYEQWLSPAEFLARKDIPEKADCWVRSP